uniref:Uncharacterized protein n=1 Tax=Anguilla anguilla TaxID=7936 RepID=A0A0E9P8G6_ANGAN
MTMKVMITDFKLSVT